MLIQIRCSLVFVTKCLLFHNNLQTTATVIVLLTYPWMSGRRSRCRLRWRRRAWRSSWAWGSHLWVRDITWMTSSKFRGPLLVWKLMQPPYYIWGPLADVIWVSSLSSAMRPEKAKKESVPTPAMITTCARNSRKETSPFSTATLKGWHRGKDLFKVQCQLRGIHKGRPQKFRPLSAFGIELT